jgi:hypothetical protein
MVGLLAYRITGLHATSGKLAAVLFALHPVQAYSVAPICGRGDVIVSAFYFAGLLCFLRYRERRKRRWLCALALSYALAVFSKEYGFTLPFLLLFTDVVWLKRLSSWRQGSTWAPYICCVIVAAVYFACRRIAFGDSTAGSSAIELTSMRTWARLVEYHGGYLAHLLPPVADWLQLWRAPPAATPPRLPPQLALVLIAGVMLAYGSWRSRGPGGKPVGTGLLFCLGFYFVATGPLVLTYFAPRHLYLASAAICVAVVIVLRRVSPSPRLFHAGAFAFSAIYLLQLQLALQPWHRAATISGAVSREVSRLGREAQAGGPIIIDVLPFIDEAVCWAWAMPFATKPPFIPASPSQVILGSPGNYGFPDRWPAQPAIPALARIEQDCWLVQATAQGQVQVKAVPAARVRTAAAALAKVSAPEAVPYAYWKFVVELKDPP